MATPVLLPLKEFLSLEKLPPRPPVLFLNRRESARLFDSVETVSPKDWERLCEKGLAILQLTPHPDGNPNYRLVKSDRNCSVEEIAKLFGIHRSVVRQWVKRGV